VLIEGISLLTLLTLLTHEHGKHGKHLTGPSLALQLRLLLYFL
jgi:hypothetical protein